MDEASTDFLKSYQVSRLGFFLLAIGLAPLCVATVCNLFQHFGAVEFLSKLGADELNRITGALTPWITLAGSTALWASWETPSWRRRAGLLMTMCLFDVGNWFLDLGDPNRQGTYAWFRGQLGASLGWSQFALLASLSGDSLTHLGVEQADESSKSTRSLAAAGAVVWLLLFLETTNFHAGWPIQRNPRFTLHALMLATGVEVILTICLLQVTALVIAAFRKLHEQVVRLTAEEASKAVEGVPFADDLGLRQDRRP